MPSQHIHHPTPQSNQTLWSTATPQPIAQSPSIQTQQDIEHQTFHEDKFQPRKLQLKAQRNSITSLEQERLGVLQAKMDGFWVQRKEQAKTQPNLLAILTHTTPTTETTLPIQPKLTVGQPDDSYEQEADQVAEHVVNMAVPPPIQPQDKEVQTKLMIQRDSLPSVPNYQLTPPSLLQPPDPTARYRLGGDLKLQLDPQLQVMIAQVLQQVSPATIRPGLSQINLALPANAPNSSPAPGSPPVATPAPTAPTVPAGVGPATARPATAGDLMKAALAIPAIDGAVTTLQTQVTDRLAQDWHRLKTGEKAIVISTALTIGGGVLAGVISDPATRRLALDQLNGKTIPVPALNWLRLEINTGGDNLMLGLHVDVGRLLPPSLGFGPSSPSAMGGPPQPPIQPKVQRMTSLLVEPLVQKQRAPLQINKKLISPGKPRTEKDWYEGDMMHWAPEMGKLAATANTFVKSAIFNTKNNAPGEYVTIAQRSAYYDVVDALAAEGILPKKIRFFGAAAKVTGRNSVGSIEGVIGSSIHSKEAIQILKDVNKILFESNMKVINKLMNSKGKPTDPKDPNATEEISAMKFDLNMVDMEQGIVEKYLKEKMASIPEEAKKDINDDLNFKGFLRTMAEYTVADTQPLEWAKKSLGTDELDFMQIGHRVAIGKALVFSLHANTLEEYLTYRKDGTLPVDRLKENYRNAFSMGVDPK